MKIYNPKAIVSDPPLAKYRALPIKPLEISRLEMLDSAYYEGVQKYIDACRNAIIWSCHIGNVATPEEWFEYFYYQEAK